MLNAKLKTFFTEIADKDFDVYKYYTLSKMKNHRGISYNPKQIPWDYEYGYFFGHKYYGLSLDMYPNTNDKGECKFNTPGVIWNLFVYERPFHVRNGTRIINKNNPEIKHFLEYFLKKSSV